MKSMIFFLILLLSFSLFQSMASSSITPNFCTAGNCIFAVTDCTSGFIRLYSSIACSGVYNKQIIFSDHNFNLNSFSPSTYYLKAFCDDGTTVSACYAITVQPSTPTTGLTTTTTKKTTCPYECCSNEATYQDRACSEGEYCQDNVCTPMSGGEGTDYTFYIVAVVVIVIVFIVLYFLFFRKKPAKKTYTQLYEKWGRR